MGNCASNVMCISHWHCTVELYTPHGLVAYCIDTSIQYWTQCVNTTAIVTRQSYEYLLTAFFDMV